jgi:hypothetical protein
MTAPYEHGTAGLFPFPWNLVTVMTIRRIAQSAHPVHYPETLTRTSLGRSFKERTRWSLVAFFFPV